MLFDPKWGPPPLEPWQLLLLNAAEVIERDGWIQRKSSTRRGVCALEALYRANERNLTDPVFMKAHDALVMTIGGSPIEWNDKKERTKAEVIAAFCKASERVTA